MIEYLKTYQWWLGLSLLLVSYVPFGFADKAAVRRLRNFSFISIRGKWFSFVLVAFYATFAIVPFFVKTTNSIGLLVAGNVVFVFGALCTLVSYANYFSSKPDETITKGLYRYSRNAIYVSALFMEIGTVILCRLWILGVVLVLHLVLRHYIILEEERYCEQTYGESYRKYKANTPRYFLIV